MGVFEYSYSAHEDEKRIVIDMRDEFDAAKSVQSYVRGIESTYSDSVSFNSIVAPVQQYGRQAFQCAIGSYAFNHSARGMSTTQYTVPALYISRPFKSGIAFGLAANYRMLGSDMDSTLAPHIAMTMRLPGLDSDDYAGEVEAIGHRSFNLGLGGYAPSPVGSPNYLRHFAEHVGRRAYGDNIDHLTQFKVGVGITRHAYHGYITQNNQQFRSVIRGIPRAQ